MEYQEHEELYLSLSRKELQGLCKQHGLPANTSNILLARSLESFFKMKNATTSPSEDTSFGASHLLESKHEAATYCLEGFNRDFGRKCERTDVSEADNCGRITHLKEKIGQLKRHCQTANQAETNSCVDIENSDKTATDMVCTYPPNRGTIGDCGCSTTDADNAGIRPLLATDIQETAALPQSGFKCQENSGKDVFKNLPELKNPRKDFLRHSAASIRLGHCGNPKCSQENCLPSSNDTPSFQFFARSDEGLHLYVDLNSSPSDWIKSLKDEVCIYKKPYCSKSGTLCHEIRGLGDGNQNSKALSTGDIETYFQTNGAERRTKSSLGSSVSGHRLSIAYPTGLCDGLSRSPVLTSGSNPPEICGYLGEGNQAAPLSCITNSNLKNCTESDTVSCLRDGGMLPDNSAGAFFNMNQTEEGCLPLSDELQDKLKPSKIGSLENHGGSCQLSSSSSCEETKPLEAGGKQKDAATAHQFDALQILDCQDKVVQTDAMELANHLLGQQACGSILKNSVPKAPTSLFTGELGTSISVKEKENSECSQSSNSVVESCKRSHSSEFPEEFRSKRQHCNSENQNGAATSLRQPLAKDSVSDTAVLPRRSVRLVSKV